MENKVNPLKQYLNRIFQIGAIHFWNGLKWCGPLTKFNSLTIPFSMHIEKGLRKLIYSWCEIWLLGIFLGVQWKLYWTKAAIGCFNRSHNCIKSYWIIKELWLKFVIIWRTWSSGSSQKEKTFWMLS